MAFISVFDVIGPNMVGPSSSHTAGAARIALLAGEMIGEPIKSVKFTLYGSFAKTYKGHGTDKALVGGMLGFEVGINEAERVKSLLTDAGFVKITVTKDLNGIERLVTAIKE